MATANVSTVFNGTVPFDVSVTAVNLLTDLSVKDFTIVNVSNNTVESNTLWTKVTPTLLRYSGGSPTLINGNTIEIRRKTPNAVVATVSYASRFSSDLYNQELDRQIRWREEADLNGVGAAAAGLTALPNDDPYSIAWGNDAVSPPTRSTLFDYFNSSLNTGFKNKLVNGRFQVWQRGTTGSIVGTTSGSAQEQRIYLADKWTYLQNTTTGTSRSVTVTREQHTPGQTLVAGTPKYFLRVNVTNAGAPGGTFSTRLVNSVEGIHLLSGRTCTLSLYARSSISNKQLGYRILRATGTATSDIGIQGSWVLDSTFKQYSVTFTLPSLTGLTMGAEGSDVYYVIFYLHSSADEVPASINGGVGTMDFSDAQLELGNTATTIEPMPMELDLINCMRYYQQSAPYTVNPNSTTAGGRNVQYPVAGTGLWADTINFPVFMARTPSVTVYSANGTPGQISRAGASVAASVTNVHTGGFFIFNNSGSSAADYFYQWSATVEYL